MTTNEGAISDLEVVFASTMDAVDPLIESALIEDYFSTNPWPLEFVAETTFDLVEAFCITEPGVFIFNLAVNYSSEDSGERTPNVQTMLLIDNEPVASSRVNDAQEPSNVALFYEATLLGTEEIKVTVMGEPFSFFVEDRQL